MSDEQTDQNVMASSCENSDSGAADNQEQAVREQQNALAEMIQRQQEAAQAIIRNMGY